MLVLTRLRKQYGDTVAVDDVDLTITKGEFFCLLGPSGCGKTTILRMVAGFEKPTGGTIMLGDRDISQLPPYARDVNTVFQNYALFPNYTVRGNIAYGPTLKKLPAGEISRRVDEAMALVGLEQLGERMPSQLSGGQQQRVALARALVNRPALLLLDEPLSALDKQIAERTRLELKDLQRRLGITFVFVTHNQVEALTMADRIAVMQHGRIEQCADPAAIYSRPTTPFVADFIGTMNFITGTVADTAGGVTTLRLADGSTAQYREGTPFPVGSSIRYGIRPEQLRVSLLPPKDFENGLHGTIARQIFMGESTQFVIALTGGATLDVSVLNYLIIAEKPLGFELNEEIYLIWSKSSGVLLNG